MVRAAKLASRDPNGKSDPYCRVYLGATDHILHRTEVKQCTLNPEWMETFTLFETELAPFLHTQSESLLQIVNMLHGGGGEYYVVERKRGRGSI